jgi:hypothetical protein
MNTPNIAFEPPNETHVTVHFELHPAGTFAGRSCAKAAPTFHPKLGRVQKHLIAVTIERERIPEWLPLFDAADIVSQVECSNGIASGRVSVKMVRAAQDSRSATVVMEALVRI